MSRVRDDLEILEKFRYLDLRASRRGALEVIQCDLVGDEDSVPADAASNLLPLV